MNVPTRPENIDDMERRLREAEKKLAVQMRTLLGSRHDQVERLERMAGLRP